MQQLLYAPFAKVEELDDGTLQVFGIASSEAEDSDGETVKADAVRAALPDYLTFGAVREMHQAIAAGTAIEASVDEDGLTHFGAHIVDASSVKKVQAGVLKGFSLGGKVTKRNKDNKKIIEGLKLTEISLVDRPANPDSVISLVKFDHAGAVMDQNLGKGADDSAPPSPDAKGRTAATRKRARATTTKNAGGADDMKKGMYDISRLADLIYSLHWLVETTTSERIYEGDDSKVPDQLQAACVALCRSLRDMVTEETSELLGLAIDLDGEELLESAAKCAKALLAEDLAKGGRKFSKATVTALGDMHKMALDMCDKFDSLGYKGADNPEDEDMADATNKGASADDLQKFRGELDDLKKAFGTLQGEQEALKDTLTKAEQARDAAVAENDELKKGIQDIVDQATAKGALRVVPKEGDTGDLGKGAGTSTTAADGKPTDVGEEIRKSWKNPRHVTFPTGAATR